MQVKAAIIVHVVLLDQFSDFRVGADTAGLGCLGDESGDGEVIHLILNRVLEHVEPFCKYLLCLGHQPLGGIID